ncbi:hypothetical protein SAMN04488029_0080 [Reichenbachiella faecimaris]|uniref:GLPGLI family protein n=1 Tax=Reichenbachiella faecimaris TaxID=692418 RepID=A0A1W2G5D9_REIFA|nr:hypothetical protein [Reichenbachiella faecimaris]SMD31744.1 hypothetical protein SAMN04488029_0080 [Reichenbachiella faecimaris]
MKIRVLSFFLLLSISAHAQIDTIVKIEFQSLSRGYYEHISITEDSLVVRKNENRSAEESVNKRALSKKEWKSLLKEFNHVNLESLPVLESPTMKRAYDGARHSSLKVYSTKSFYEHLFDDDNPHTKLQPVMKCIRSIAN